MKKRRKWMAVLLSLSLAAGTFAVPAETVRAYEQDITNQNLVVNPSFKDDTSGWSFSEKGAGIAENNAHDGDSKHFYLDGSQTGEFYVSQKIRVPADGVYTASVWVSTGAGGGRFGIRREDGTDLGSADLANGGGYKQYTLDSLELQGGEKVEIYVTAATYWVNGDEFSLVCTEQKGEIDNTPDYIFDGNMVRNPSFADSDSWIMSTAGYASNNGHNGSGDRHFYINQAKGSISQQFQVPYTGYYKAGLWVASAGTGGKFIVSDVTTGETKESEIALNTAYTRYETEIWMNKGDLAEVRVTGASGWVNGDDISLEYNTSRFENMIVDPEFTDGSAWETAGNVQFSQGAVLDGAESSISQSLYIPLEGAYYAEVVLGNAEGASVSFAGNQSETVNGTQTVRVEAESLTAAASAEDLVELAVSGKADVKKADVKFDLAKMPNKAPSVSDIMVTGDCTAGMTLETSYTFTDPDSHTEGSSEYQWLISGEEDGEYTELEGETRRNLALKEEWEDQYLKFRVTPVDQYAMAGEALESSAAGPVDLNLVGDPGFESNGRGWSGISISNQKAHTGLNRGIVKTGKTASQTITVPRSAYYDLSGYARYDGTDEGSIALCDEAGNELGKASVEGLAQEETEASWKQAEVKHIPLEEGQKVKLVLTGAQDKDYDVDSFSLKRDRKADVPAFKNVKVFRTSPEAFDTVIDPAAKTVQMSFLYGTDLTKIKAEEITVSEGASVSIKSGDILDLSEGKEAEFTVRGSDQTEETWKVTGTEKEKKVAMTSSNKNLEKTFNWAANKMDQFVMTGKKGPVNVPQTDGTEEVEYIPSYWAGYYDRTAFYTRDFVHQATGAQIAGLAEENYSMFEAFAKECTEARKWYTVWALNFDGSVYTMDYNNENSFVREVPAQFELVEKAYKQYLWSGDRRYIEDDVLWNFYTNVMTNYVDIHDANGNGVAQEVGTGIFDGSCTYNERGRHVIEAGDAIGSQYQATLAYAGMLKARGEETESQKWYEKAAELKKYFNETWSVADDMESDFVCAWGPDGQRYSDFSKETSWFIPLKMISDPGERNDGYIDFLLENLGDGIGTTQTAPNNIEAYTYIPDMLFLYNRSDDAWKWMKYISSIKDDPHERPIQGTNGDYPEISFTYVSHAIEGMMGVEPDAGEKRVATSPRLPSEVSDMAVRYMQIGDYELDLAHNSNTDSTLTNHGQEAITWEARFYGSHPYLKAGDQVLPAKQKEINGVTVSYAQVSVPAGESAHVCVTAGEGAEDEEAKKAAAKVEELINKIGTVTSASKEAIEAAREAYEALSDEAKKLVSNLQILESAEKTYKDITSNEDTVKIKISQTQIKKIPEQIYTGKAKMPVPVITYQGKALIKGKDYQTAYSRNTNIGTAQVQITGIGNYTGTITESFQITVKKNTVHTVGNYKYKITDAKTNGKGTVTLTGLKNKTTGKKLKKITVAKTVSIGGKKFNITEIGSKAFSECRKATNASIGANVKKVGPKAFYNCKKLRKITISSTKLKSVGKGALKNISSKARIKVPKKQLKKYKKILKSKGQKKSVKIMA